MGAVVEDVGGEKMQQVAASTSAMSPWRLTYAKPMQSDSAVSSTSRRRARLIATGSGQLAKDFGLAMPSIPVTTERRHPQMPRAIPADAREVGRPRRAPGILPRSRRQPAATTTAARAPSSQVPRSGPERCLAAWR